MAEPLTPDICVIGGGAAGLAVARRARAAGASVVLVERGRLGGEALSAAAFPSKALVAAARRAQVIRTAAPFGIGSAEPQVSARGVYDYVHAIVDDERRAVAPEQVRAHGIELIAAAARFTDPRTLSAGTQPIRARRFVIATGSKPAIPPIPGLDAVPYFTSASILDNPRKLTHLVVIGAGAVGLEMAQAYRRLGAEVTVIDSAAVLADIDPELVAVLLRQLNEDGIALKVPATVVEVQPRSLGIGVLVRSSDGEDVLDASHILVATGRSPTLEGLDVERAGIARLGRHGALALRADLRTSNRRIYAVGDAAGGREHVQSIGYQAAVVVRRALFGLPARFDPTHVPSAVFTDPELAVVGLSEPEARRRHGDFRLVRLSLAENDRARLEGQRYGVVKLLVGRGERLLGAGIAGTAAAELISLFAFAIANGMSLMHFRRFIAPYPTLGDVFTQLADEAALKYGQSPVRRRLLALNRLLP